MEKHLGDCGSELASFRNPKHFAPIIFHFDLNSMIAATNLL